MAAKLNPGAGSEDPRTIITPDAFSVSPELLGIPLAQHSRRAGAILVDLLLVALLANAGGIFLGLAAGLLLFRLATRPSRRDGTPVRRLFRGGLGCLGASVLFVTILSIWGVLSPAPRPDHYTGPSAAELRDSLRAGWEGRVDSIVAEATSGAPGRVQEGEAPGIRSFLRRLAEDLGIGIGWSALYFTVFTNLWKGRTPGKRLFGLRVVHLDRAPITWWSAFERYGGYAAGFATGLVGFAQVYWDPNRQATHDKIARTVVIQEGRDPVPGPWNRTRPPGEEGESPRTGHEPFDQGPR